MHASLQNVGPDARPVVLDRQTTQAFVIIQHAAIAVDAVPLDTSHLFSSALSTLGGSIVLHGVKRYVLAAAIVDALNQAVQGGACDA